MRHTFPAVVLWPLILGALVQLVPAQDAAPTDKAIGVPTASGSAPARPYAHLHALCIGINKYGSSGIPELSYAEADAHDVAAVLRDVYGFDHVVELLGAKATRAGINDALAELFDPKKIGRDDGAVIYFSGHGQTVQQGAQEAGYLIPQDARIDLADVRNPAQYRRDAIRMDDLRTDADGIPAKHVLFIIDACYSGYLASRSLEGTAPLAAALRYPARQVITAGTKGEQAVEHNAWSHGAFTYKLLQILRTEEKPLLASALGVMLKERVPQEVAAKFGNKLTLSPQAKYLSGEGDFVLVRKDIALEIPPLQTASPLPADSPPPRLEGALVLLAVRADSLNLNSTDSAQLAADWRTVVEKSLPPSVGLKPPPVAAKEWQPLVLGQDGPHLRDLARQAGARILVTGIAHIEWLRDIEVGGRPAKEYSARAQLELVRTDADSSGAKIYTLPVQHLQVFQVKAAEAGRRILTKVLEAPEAKRQLGVIGSDCAAADAANPR
jgi:uncharacterized caspase-like protein